MVRPKGSKLVVVNGKKVCVWPDGTPVKGTAKPMEPAKVSPPPVHQPNTATSPDYPPPIQGDDLFYLADSVKMVADQLVEVTRALGKIRADLHKVIEGIQNRPPPPVPAPIGV